MFTSVEVVVHTVEILRAQISFYWLCADTWRNPNKFKERRNLHDKRLHPYPVLLFPFSLCHSLLFMIIPQSSIVSIFWMKKSNLPITRAFIMFCFFTYTYIFLIPGVNVEWIYLIQHLNLSLKIKRFVFYWNKSLFPAISKSKDEGKPGQHNLLDI